MKEEDVFKFFVVGIYLGGINFDFQMEQYIYKRKSDGIYIINFKRIWEKFLLVVCVIVVIENFVDVSVIFFRNIGQRVVLKFVVVIGVILIVGCFIFGIFINQIQVVFWELWFFVVIDFRVDYQFFMEVFYVNLFIIVLCNIDFFLCYVDIVILCNNKGVYLVGLMWWMLVWEVLCMCGIIFCEYLWEVMFDLYFYRDFEEIEKEEQVVVEKVVIKEEFQGEWIVFVFEFIVIQFEVVDWFEGVQVFFVFIQ